jgi:hypothetical protein
MGLLNWTTAQINAKLQAIYDKLNDSATLWDDLDLPLIIRTTGVGIPSRTLISGGVYGYTYAVNDGLDIDAQELQHRFKQAATTGKFHVHILTNGSNTSDRYVKFTFEYLHSNIGGVFAGATITSPELLIPANTPDRTHLIFDIGDYTALNIGSQIIGRLTRVAATGTAPGSAPFVLKCQIHLEIDSLGSKQITSK